MPVPTSIDDLSPTVGSNSPAGSESPVEGDNYLRTHASFIALLRDKLDGTDNTGTIKNATFSGTMAGAASWAALQTFAAGLSAPTSALGNNYSSTYTATLTSGTNQASTPTGGVGHYVRVGNRVLGTISVSYILTSASAYSAFRFSLPVSSDIAASTDLTGVGVSLVDSNSKTNSCAIYGNAATNDATVEWVPVSGAAAVGTMKLDFAYMVI